MSLEEEDYDKLQAELAAELAKLDPIELAWRDKQRFLESKGYMLRVRYRPDWVPSWQNDLSRAFRTEDSITHPYRPSLVDATRISDGRLVYLKRVATGDSESDIAKYFSSNALRDDPDNHCVPILDVIQDEEEPYISYIVMPFLRLMDDPPFTFVNDIVDMADQLLKGLVYMHRHSVAHRDCARKNIMMDAFSLYPYGFHPVQTSYLPDFSARATYLPRFMAPIKYYYVDFGIAIKVPPGENTKLVTGRDGQDQEVPELSLTVPYDPFKVDIFILGNVFRKSIHAKFSNVEFLQPLIKAMTQQDPTRRPDADAILQQWRKIRGSIFLAHRGWRLHERSEGYAQTIVFDMAAFLKLGMLLSQRFLVWTARLLALFRRLF